MASNEAGSSAYLNFLAAFIAELEKNLTKEQLAGAKKELDRLKSGKSAESLPSAL